MARSTTVLLLAGAHATWDRRSGTQTLSFGPRALTGVPCGGTLSRSMLTLPTHWSCAGAVATEGRGIIHYPPEERVLPPSRSAGFASKHHAALLASVRPSPGDPLRGPCRGALGGAGRARVRLLVAPGPPALPPRLTNPKPLAYQASLRPLSDSLPALDECRSLLTSAKRNCTGTCGKCLDSLDRVEGQCIDGCRLASSSDGASFLGKFSTYRLATIGEQCYQPQYQYSTVVDVDCGENVRSDPTPLRLIPFPPPTTPFADQPPPHPSASLLFPPNPPLTPLALLRQPRRRS